MSDDNARLIRRNRMRDKIRSDYGERPGKAVASAIGITLNTLQCALYGNRTLPTTNAKIDAWLDGRPFVPQQKLDIPPPGFAEWDTRHDVSGALSEIYWAALILLGTVSDQDRPSVHGIIENAERAFEALKGITPVEDADPEFVSGAKEARR